MMVKKVFRYTALALICVVVVIFSLAAVGTIAQAAGLVDDTVNAGNLYSQYPLMNYRLDFYVDNSWGWLPWNWKDGLGKSVMYGIYCITNFLWILSLYISNATGYVVEQAYKLEFVSDMADYVGRNMQTLAGVDEHGFHGSGYYVGFLSLLLLVLGVYVTYVGLLKRETSKAISALLNFFLVFILSAAFIAGAPTYIKKINEFSSDVSVATLDLSSKIILSDEDNKGQDSVSRIRDCLFSVQVKQPWLLLQFGESDESKIGRDRVESILSVSSKVNGGEDRENAVKKEIEEQGNNNLTVTEVVNRLGMTVFLLIFNLGISVFVFLMCGFMVFSQVLFMIYAMLLPVSFVLALIPTYSRNVKKIIEKLFNVIMMRAGITLVVTITFSVSTMLYQVSSEYPFFMVAFLQVVVFFGVYSQWGDLVKLFGLNGSESQQVSQRLLRKPYMFLRRGMGHMERKVKGSVRKVLYPGNRKVSRQNASTKKKDDELNKNRDIIQEKSSDTISQNWTDKTPEHRNKRPDISNQSEKESPAENIKNNRRFQIWRPNVKTSAEHMGNRVGAVVDTKSRIRDNVELLKDRIKDAPVNSAHKVYEQKKKIRDNVNEFKKGVADERLNRLYDRDIKRDEYQRNMEKKRNDLKQDKEYRYNKRYNVKQDNRVSEKAKQDKGKRRHDE